MFGLKLTSFLNSRYFMMDFLTLCAFPMTQTNCLKASNSLSLGAGLAKNA